MSFFDKAFCAFSVVVLIIAVTVISPAGCSQKNNTDQTSETNATAIPTLPTPSPVVSDWETKIWMVTIDECQYLYSNQGVIIHKQNCTNSVHRQ